MSDEVAGERVRIIAASAGVSLDKANAERVANAISPTVKRLSSEKITLPLEVEPGTFADAASKDRTDLPPLHGVPLAHKDMFYVTGKLAGCGSKIRR